MALVKIPTTANPWSININNVTYGPYSAGEEVEVPEVVAEFIEAITPVKEAVMPPAVGEAILDLNDDGSITSPMSYDVRALELTPLMVVTLRGMGMISRVAAVQDDISTDFEKGRKSIYFKCLSTEEMITFHGPIGGTVDEFTYE